MTSVRRVAPLVSVVVTALALLAACGADGADRPVLTPEGEAGRALALSKGCAACHGVYGQGGVGPKFTGLFNSTVVLDDDAPPVVADEAYLIEAIKDPNATLVAGYTLPMPETDLSDDEIASLVGYIRELAAPTTRASTSATTSATP